MNESTVKVVHEYLPFYITGPGESDILFTAVAIALVAIIIGFGALYFTIQAIPDRLVEGAGKAQMQVVGLLGLISLFTMNNLYWIAAILLAAMRIPDFVTPLTDIARSMKDRQPETPVSTPVETNAALAVQDIPAVNADTTDLEPAEQEPATDD